MSATASSVPVISVVIPTAGTRPVSLAAAVASVAIQDLPEAIEIVVVDDSDGGIDADALQHAAGDIDVRIVSPIPEVGQRSAGVTAAQGEWIAFLDDDDAWAPQKLRKQLAIAKESQARGRECIISCRLQHSFDDTDRVVGGIPARVIRPGQGMGDYLFVRREPSIRRASLFTSTLLASRSLCLEVGWRRLARHQDWDWLLRAASRPDVDVIHHPEDLATIHVGSPGSISAKPDWRSSLQWASHGARPHLSREAYADFVAAQVLRYALNARSLSGTAQALAELWRNRRAPSRQALAVGFAGLLPRRSLQKLMSLPRGLRPPWRPNPR